MKKRKIIIVVSLILCIIVLFVLSMIILKNSQLLIYFKRNYYIKQLCKDHSIPLHFASVSEMENVENGYILFFKSDGGISDSSVTAAITLYNLIESDECNNTFLQDTALEISVYAVDTPYGGFTISNCTEDNDMANKIVSFSSSIKDMCGIRVLTPIKSDLEFISIMDAQYIRTDDFKDFTSLKKIKLIDCKDEAGKNTYTKNNIEDFSFYNDNIDFDILNTY